MKKALPFILLLAGFIVVIGAVLFVKSRGKTETEIVEEEEIALIEVELQNMPVVTLTPRSDGYWLDMLISKLGRFEAESMDYELLYKVPRGGTQGTGGSVKLQGRDEVEREILFGSESSGNYYYDEGVEEGTLTLRFRNDKGKLLVKFVTDFILVSDVDTVTSKDGVFSFTLKDDSPEYYVAMDSVGFPGDDLPGVIEFGLYGLFTSSKKDVEGEVDLGESVYVYGEGEWIKVDGTSGQGIYVSVFASAVE